MPNNATALTTEIDAEDAKKKLTGILMNIHLITANALAAQQTSISPPDKKHPPTWFNSLDAELKVAQKTRRRVGQMYRAAPHDDDPKIGHRLLRSVRSDHDIDQ
jgi:hypothetical protein